jgi:hypothetical protein
MRIIPVLKELQELLKSSNLDLQHLYFKTSFHISSLNSSSNLIKCLLSFGSVFLASQSLAYVSFPVQAIMKSSKILSILIVALLFGYSSQHTKRQYLCGLLITTGIIMFTLGQVLSLPFTIYVMPP